MKDFTILNQVVSEKTLIKNVPMCYIKGVKKVRSAIKLYSLYSSHCVPNAINVTGIL